MMYTRSNYYKFSLFVAVFLLFTTISLGSWLHLMLFLGNYYLAIDAFNDKLKYEK